MLLVDVEEDINKVLKYFSYEHFYVIYCKFWELDTDHGYDQSLLMDRPMLSASRDVPYAGAACIPQAGRSASAREALSDGRPCG